MPRIISQADATELARKGKAVYEKEDEKAELTSIKHMVEALTNKIIKVNQETRQTIIDAIQGEDAEESEQESPPDMEDTQELEMLNKISAKLDMLLKSEKSDDKHPKKWHFDIERDLVGEMTGVTATEITNGE